MADPVTARNFSLKPGLYCVATPIGNLGDMTERAKKTLQACDKLLCEDTRISRRLLDAYGIKKQLIAYHDHNGDEMRPKILAWLSEGSSVALISDAGTPLISDPGYKLVDKVQEASYPVTAIPGASALTAALSIAGLPTDRFTFAGFPPPKTIARQKWFEELDKVPGTLVFYESAKRINACLKDASKILTGERRVAICREITKKFEEVVRDDLIKIALYYDDKPCPKGEIVVVIGPGKNTGLQKLPPLTEKLLENLIPTMGVKAAATLVSDVTGENRKSLYAKALELKEPTV